MAIVDSNKPMWVVYIFFLVHMGGFGGSGFAMAYFVDAPIAFLYVHGGIAIFIYVIFYLAIFGLDKVKWMFINAFLGVFGLYSEINNILSWGGKNIHDFPVYVHVVPFLYYVLYTFLLRQIVIDLTRSRGDRVRSDTVSYAYFGISLGWYSFMYLAG